MSNWTIKSLDEMDDVLGDYPGEMYMTTYAIGAEQVALTHRRMPPQTGGKGGYAPLVSEIVRFFKTGKAPVSAAETTEVFAFMEAADESKREGGKPVKLADVMAKNKP